MPLVRKILIVEDEMISGLCLEMEFRHHGFEVCRPPATAAAALEAAVRERPDVLLMDISLPGETDGITAAAAITAAVPLVVIFMTGYDDPGLQQRAEALRPLGYYTKPLPAVQEIVDLIQAHFAGGAVGG